MQRRVQRVVLVSSLYDSFIMSEEGHLQETLLSHFIDLNLSHTPDLVQVPHGEAALDLLGRDDRVDLVVASLHAGDRDAAQLARDLRAAGIAVPVIALAYNGRELHEFQQEQDTSALERTFLWQGDVRIFLAIVKHLEDRLNAANDIGACGVPALLVVEDSIRFYSSFLPAIYSELYAHTLGLLAEDLNLSQKMLRMRARPRVLLATSFEEAWEFFEQYEEQILGVLSDIQFAKDGELSDQAGIELCERALAVRPGLRLVLQSSNAANREQADASGASFLQMGSATLLQELRQLLVERFGFGDFVFRNPSGVPIDQAHDLGSFLEKLRTVPDETFAYHAERHHYSNWLKARTELSLAERIRPRTLEEFGGDVPALRACLTSLIEEYRRERHRTVIANFDRERFEPSVSITRIGDGSLGGKARGVAFANRVLHEARLEQQFPGVEIRVPPAVVFSTQIFDEFLAYEGLHDDLLAEQNDDAVIQRCLDAPFPRRAVADVRTFLQKVKYPLAIRSSSLLEDSLSQPFAGIYHTFMLANNHHELDVRSRQLAQAVKSVIASAYLSGAKTYLSMTSFRLEEEKMAVMAQELVGRGHGDRFYPDFSGVARSYNFYPEPGHSPEDGVAALALGLGRTVVGGDPCLRFCPRHPRHVIGFSSVESTLAGSQRDFYALDLRRESQATGLPEAKYPLASAEEDDALRWSASTYVPDDHRIVEGTARAGVRLVTFARVLKRGEFPLPEILSALLERCRDATGSAVEIEFAGNFPRDGRRGSFNFLQLRPLAVARESADVEIGDVDPARIVCRSEQILGNGRIDDLHDLVLVDRKTFERSNTREVAKQIASYDARLRAEGRPYVLIGMGRWGSADPSLGIPVTWNQIAGVRVIIEAGFDDLRVAPSQGTHFFQNLASSHVGYFTVNPDLGEGRLDWDWLGALPGEQENSVRLVHLEQPLSCVMSGRKGEGVMLR